MIDNDKTTVLQALSTPLLRVMLLALELVGETGPSELKVPTAKLVDWVDSISSPDV